MTTKKDPITVLKTATAKKLNPNLDSDLEYQIALIEGVLHLRISANSSGGYFSKEWISLEKMEKCFDADITTDIDFKSTVLKPLFEQGKSANNTGFLSACLRAEKLLSPSSKSLFLHRFTGDFNQWKKTLNLLNKK